MTLLVKYNRVVIALLFFIPLFSCNSGESRIRGLLTHLPNKMHDAKLYLHATDGSFKWPGEQKEVLDSCNINDDGFFTFEHIPSHNALFFDITDGETVLLSNFYLQPGQKIRLDFDYKYTPPLLLGTAQAGQLNHLLEAFSDTFYREQKTKAFYYGGSNYLLAPEYAQYIDQRHVQELDFVKRHMDVFVSDTLFKTYLKSEIDYQWANDKTAFLWKKWIRNEEVRLDSSYFNFINELKINNPAALISPAYIRFLHLFIRELHRQLPIEQQKKTPTAYLRSQLAQKYLNGMPLKVALLQILKDEISNCRSLGETDQVQLASTATFADHLDSITSGSDFSVYFALHKPQ